MNTNCSQPRINDLFFERANLARPLNVIKIQFWCFTRIYIGKRELVFILSYTWHLLYCTFGYISLAFIDWYDQLLSRFSLYLTWESETASRSLQVLCGQLACIVRQSSHYWNVYNISLEKKELRIFGFLISWATFRLDPARGSIQISFWEL